MRISPVFSQAIRPNMTTMGQGFQKADCRKPVPAPALMESENSRDIYFSLAEASMRDKKIELELKTMGLI